MSTINFVPLSASMQNRRYLDCWYDDITHCTGNAFTNLPNEYDYYMNHRKPFCYAHLYGNVGITKTYFGKKILLNTQKHPTTYNIIDNGVIEKAICKILEDNIKHGNVFVMSEQILAF